MAKTEVQKGGGAQYGWGTERKPIWVKRRELGEHEQNAAGEMDRVRLLGLWAVFRLWTSPWNQWETTGGLKAGERWSHVLAEWSKSDAEGHVRDKDSSLGELVLGACLDRERAVAVMRRLKAEMERYLEHKARVWISHEGWWRERVQEEFPVFV